MKLAQKILSLSAVLAFVAACLTVPTMAQDRDRVCSVATLKGNYGLHGSGIRAAGPGVSETHETLAIRSYDGKGSVTSTAIITQGTVTGLGEGDGSSATGTYEVNPDCTGKVTITLATPRGPEPREARFVIENHGREIVEVPTGGVQVAILKRQ